MRISWPHWQTSVLLVTALLLLLNWGIGWYYGLAAVGYAPPNSASGIVWSTTREGVLIAVNQYGIGEGPCFHCIETDPLNMGNELSEWLFVTGDSPQKPEWRHAGFDLVTGPYWYDDVGGEDIVQRGIAVPHWFLLLLVFLRYSIPKWIVLRRRRCSHAFDMSWLATT